MGGVNLNVSKVQIVKCLVLEFAFLFLRNNPPASLFRSSYIINSIRRSEDQRLTELLANK
jgi:hypothetical protein